MSENVLMNRKDNTYGYDLETIWREREVEQEERNKKRRDGFYIKIRFSTETINFEEN